MHRLIWQQTHQEGQVCISCHFICLSNFVIFNYVFLNHCLVTSTTNHVKGYLPLCALYHKGTFPKPLSAGWMPTQAVLSTWYTLHHQRLTAKMITVSSLFQLTLTISGHAWLTSCDIKLYPRDVMNLMGGIMQKKSVYYLYGKDLCKSQKE